ncbi:unnamed protein product [Adineta ricciae]|uniref:Uncharacterized protein n=1 Tax=Adineta ricciae TaxID=249248 RepID=A0A815BZ15_ADIRI|nr:unnamed protein product [Adineta ricciae]
MPAEIQKSHCVKCGKERFTSTCSGCLQDFCFDHLTMHQQELNRQLDHLELKRDLFQETFNDEINLPDKYSLIKQIEQWEEKSIELIHETANQCKEILFKHTNEYFHQIDICFMKLTEQLRKLRQQNDFNEIDLNYFKDKLKKLQQQFDRSPNIYIQQHPTEFISQISVLASFGKFVPSLRIANNSRWKEFGATVAGDIEDNNELHSPYGLCIDDNYGTVYIADCGNHRIIEYKCGINGEVIVGGNGEGNRMDQLNYPTDVILDKRNDSLIICDYRNCRVVRWFRGDERNFETIISNINCWGITMDNNGDLYVSDWKNNEVRKWKQGNLEGVIVAGGNGEDYSIYISDTLNHRVVKWFKNSTAGIVVAGGRGPGNHLQQLSFPRGIIGDHLGNIYIADSGNDRVVRWLKDARQGTIVVGGSGKGNDADQFNSLKGITFDRHGNLFVADKDNHRVQKFDIQYE